MTHERRLKHYARKSRQATFRKEAADRVSQDDNRGRDYWREFMKDSDPQDDSALNEAQKILEGLVENVDDLEYSSKANFMSSVDDAMSEAENLVNALKAFRENVLNNYNEYSQLADE